MALQTRRVTWVEDVHVRLHVRSKYAQICTNIHKYTLVKLMNLIMTCELMNLITICNLMSLIITCNLMNLIKTCEQMNLITTCHLMNLIITCKQITFIITCNLMMHSSSYQQICTWDVQQEHIILECVLLLLTRQRVSYQQTCTCRQMIWVRA